MISSVKGEEQMEVPMNGQTDPGEWNGEQPDIHPAVARAFRALGSGLPWVLLRGEDDLVRPTGDVDVLVADGEFPRLDALLAGAGFRRVVAHGHGSHRFYFSYDATEDLIDVTYVVNEGEPLLLRSQLGLLGGCIHPVDPPEVDLAGELIGHLAGRGPSETLVEAACTSEIGDAERQQADPLFHIVLLASCPLQRTTIPPVADQRKSVRPH